MAIHLLVVDDEQSLAYLLEYFLGDLGYAVITANNGQVALQILQRRPVELIISDIMMPIKDGYQFVKELRTQPLIASIPVLLVSSAPINRARLKPHKAEAYITKLFELEHMEKAVKSLIKLAS